MCKQCGECCHRGDFWQYSNHPVLMAMYSRIDHINGEGKCMMLDGKVCLIEKHLGKQHKPLICRDFDCGLAKQFHSDSEL